MRRLIPLAFASIALGCASTPAPEPASPPPAPTMRAERRAPTPQPERIATDAQCNDWEVFFATGSAEITEPARAVLGGLAECIQRGDVRDVSIVGSADPRGAAPDNLQLGQQRAEAIRAVLIARGCDPNVVRAASVGEARASGDPSTYAMERHARVRTRDR